MSIRSLNGLGNPTNVYINTNLSATEPLEVSQTSFNNPITLSLKGISGFGTAGQVMKVHSNGQKLVWGDDDSSNWIVSGTKIYPKTATHLLVNTTTDSHNRTLKINGDAEIATQLYLTGTSSTIQIDNNSSSGLYFKNATNQGFKFYADNGFSGSPHLNNETLSGWLFKISSTSTIKHRFLNGQTEIYSIGGSSDTTQNYFVKASDTNIGNYIQNDFTNNTFQLRKFTSLTDEYFLQYDTANEVLTIPDKLVLSATTNQLSNGTYNYILPSSSGTLMLTTDPVDVSTATNFGTAASSDVNIGYAGGSSLSIGLNLYGDEFKLYNTGNVNVATFTPVSNSCNLTLNGGVISSANYQGSAIAYNYGGTGITSFGIGDAGKILQVNSTTNGYDLVNPTSQYWTESGGVLSPATSTNAIRSEASLAFRVGSASSYTALDYNTSSNLFSLYNTASGVNFIEYNGTINVITNKVSTIFENQIQVNSIKGENSTTNTIKDDGARGWEFIAVDATRAIAIESGSYYPYIGVDTSKPFLIHINNISGNAYEINNTNNTLSGLRHEFYGDVVFNSVIRAEGGSLPIRIGSTGDYTALEYSESSDIFYLYNSTSTKYFMEYQAVPQTTKFNCNNFTISSGTANNDCILLIEADTDNNDEDANPRIKLSQDQGLVYSHIEMNTNNELKLETFYSGSKIVLNPVSGANCEINSTLTKCSGDLECASSQFRVSYSSSYTRIRNYNSYPSNTNGASHIYFHDNGTSLSLNLPNTSYTTSNSNAHIFLSGNEKRVRINGSTNPLIRYYKADGAETPFFNIGVSATFPTEMGGTWDGVSVPIGEAYFQGGEETNDYEGFWFAQNGQTTAFSSTADLQAMRWYNEDSITTGWYISSSGSISTFSDRRLKTDINDWKDTDKEKYKKIRTICYKEKIPENINSKRLEKQSCIDHYNERHYGVIAQEIFELYPEIKNDSEIREYNEWKYRKDNWNNGIYEKEHKEWEEAKEKYECCDQKDCEDKCLFKTPEPQKEFNEEEPYLHLDYNRLNIITIGVVQDLITENETLKQEVNTYKQIIDKLIKAPSFKAFKESLA